MQFVLHFSYASDFFLSIFKQRLCVIFNFLIIKHIRENKIILMSKFMCRHFKYDFITISFFFPEKYEKYTRGEGKEEIKNGITELCYVKNGSKNVANHTHFIFCLFYGFTQFNIFYLYTLFKCRINFI